jgi:hypothetical protein
MAKRVMKNCFLGCCLAMLAVCVTSTLFSVAREDDNEIFETPLKQSKNTRGFARKYGKKNESQPASPVELDDSETLVKEIIITNWKEGFKQIVDPVVIDGIFTTEAMHKLAAGIDSIDALEVFGRFNKLKFAYFFREHPLCFNILEANIKDFFVACHDFVSLFRHLSDSYYRDRKLAAYLKVTMGASLVNLPMVNNLWCSFFEICNNNSDLEDLEFLANNYYEQLKSNKRSNNNPKIQNMVDYVFAKRALEIHTKTCEEFKKINQYFEVMTEDSWLAQNPLFIDKYYMNRALKELDGTACAAVVFDKLLQAKSESAHSVVEAQRNAEAVSSDIERLQKLLVGRKGKVQKIKKKTTKKRIYRW